MRNLLHRVDRLMLAAPHRSLGAIVLLALLLASARLSTNPPTLQDDQIDNWWPVALSVLNGDGFRSCLPLYFPYCGPGNDLSAMREPLPVLVCAGLAGLHRSLWTVALFQVLVYLVTVVLVHRLARRLAGERAGLIAALIWALYLPVIQVLPQVGGDMLACLGCVGATLAFLHARERGGTARWVIAGVALGVAALSRTALMGLSLPFGIALLWPLGGHDLAVRVKHAVVYGITFIALIAPWTLRNHAVFGRWVAGSTLTGYNLLRHNHHLGTAPLYRYIAADEAEPVTRAALARHTELTGTENEAEVDAVYRMEGNAIVKAHPVDYLRLSLWRAVPLWTNYGVVQAYGENWKPVDTAMLAMQVLLLALFMAGLRKGGAPVLLLAALVLVFCASHMLVVCRMRYLVPLMPLVIAVGARTLDRVWRRIAGL